MYRNQTAASQDLRANSGKSRAFNGPAESTSVARRLLFKSKENYQMASKRSGSKAASGKAGDGKRKPGKEGLKDLDPKGGQKIRGGKWSRDNGSVSSSTSNS